MRFDPHSRHRPTMAPAVATFMIALSVLGPLVSSEVCKRWEYGFLRGTYQSFPASRRLADSREDCIQLVIEQMPTATGASFSVVPTRDDQFNCYGHYGFGTNGSPQWRSVRSDLDFKWRSCTFNYFQINVFNTTTPDLLKDGIEDKCQLSEDRCVTGTREPSSQGMNVVSSSKYMSIYYLVGGDTKASDVVVYATWTDRAGRFIPDAQLESFKLRPDNWLDERTGWARVDLNAEYAANLPYQMGQGYTKGETPPIDYTDLYLRHRDDNQQITLSELRIVFFSTGQILKRGGLLEAQDTYGYTRNGVERAGGVSCCDLEQPVAHENRFVCTRHKNAQQCNQIADNSLTTCQTIREWALFVPELDNEQRGALVNKSTFSDKLLIRIFSSKGKYLHGARFQCGSLGYSNVNPSYDWLVAVGNTVDIAVPEAELEQPTWVVFEFSMADNCQSVGITAGTNKLQVCEIQAFMEITNGPCTYVRNRPMYPFSRIGMDNENQPCGLNSTCRSYPGTYRCNCDKGTYSPSGREDDCIPLSYEKYFPTTAETTTTV